MTQDMSEYKTPPTCVLVTPTKPRTGHDWKLQQPGAGFGISGHDHETRDACFKRASGPPGPAPPPPPPGPNPPPPPPPPPPPGGAGDYVLVLQARFAWWRAGTVSTSAGAQLQNGSAALTLSPYGRPAITVRGWGERVALPPTLVGGLGYCSHANTSQACVAFALTPGQPLAFSSSAGGSPRTAIATVGANRRALLQSYAAYGADYAWAAEAVGASVGWNFVFGPSELGPHLPVSPGWAGGYMAPYDDFNEGGSFGWDCTFASYLAGLGSKKMGPSSAPFGAFRAPPCVARTLLNRYYQSTTAAGRAITAARTRKSRPLAVAGGKEG